MKLLYKVLLESLVVVFNIIFKVETIVEKTREKFSSKCVTLFVTVFPCLSTIISAQLIITVVQTLFWYAGTVSHTLRWLGGHKMYDENRGNKDCKFTIRHDLKQHFTD